MESQRVNHLLGHLHWLTVLADQGRPYPDMAPADLAAALAKRLAMFVLRAKVKLSDASDQLKVIGLAGALAHELLSSAWGEAPREPWQKKSQDGAELICLYSALGQERALWLSEQTPPPDWPSLPLPDWQALEVLNQTRPRRILGTVLLHGLLATRTPRPLARPLRSCASD